MLPKILRVWIEVYVAVTFQVRLVELIGDCVGREVRGRVFDEVYVNV